MLKLSFVRSVFRYEWYYRSNESLFFRMASRAFSSPRSLHMLLPILFVSIGILLIAVIKQNQELSDRSESTMVVPEGWSTYTNPSLKLSVAIPSDADIAANVESPSSTTDRLGRVGGMSVNSNSYEKPFWSVRVYTAQTKLEHDFGAADGETLIDEMKSLGLQTKTATIDGVSANVFSGVHPVDGVGGSEYDYVAAEIVGSTYSYMIEFRNMGTDPDAAAIVQYLSGFDAE